MIPILSPVLCSASFLDLPAKDAHECCLQLPRLEHRATPWYCQCGMGKTLMVSLSGLPFHP